MGITRRRNGKITTSYKNNKIIKQLLPEHRDVCASHHDVLLAQVLQKNITHISSLKTVKKKGLKMTAS
jgi:hypothetical protein